MPYIVTYQVFNEDHSKENSYGGISQIHEIPGFEVETIGHEIVGVMHQVFKDDGCQAAKDTNDKAQENNELAVPDVPDPPYQQAAYDFAAFHCAAKLIKPHNPLFL